MDIQLNLLHRTRHKVSKRTKKETI